jgi:membrane protease YdiL (CAAX protease family)
MALFLSHLFSAFVNAMVLGAAPVLIYASVQKRRGSLIDRDIAQRVGLQLCERRYILYAIAFAAVMVAALVLASLPMEPFQRRGSPQADLVGIGLGGPAIPIALVYGILKTGFPEEVLFRGLIAGSLSRHMRFAWANLIQAAIFLLPHLLILIVMPELWWFLPIVYVGALYLGWLRIRSGSIIPSWIIHASLNVAICLIAEAHVPA